MVNIDEAEASNLANQLGKTREAFDEAYISKGESGRMVINAIPCHFLVGNSCSVYEPFCRVQRISCLSHSSIKKKNVYDLYALRPLPYYI
jgi:hypothetical protein